MNQNLPALRVVITDDEGPARHRLKDLLEDCSESVPAEVVGEAASGHELIELLETVSAPARSVMCTSVLLNEEYMFAIPQRSTRFSEMTASSCYDES